VRVALGPDLVSGRSAVRSVIVHGDRQAAEHAWRPSTVAGYRSTVGYLVRDKLASQRAVEASPSVLRAVCAAWSTAGWPDPTIWSRVRVLRSALCRAHAERVLDHHPLEEMRGPAPVRRSQRLTSRPDGLPIAKASGPRRDVAEPTDVADPDDSGQECRSIGFGRRP
jgi:hypothetical protein